MKLFYWESPHGNFGDDMNCLVWPKLMPGFFDDDESELFVGIGTILSHEIPEARRRIVMGSGTGYGRLPHDLHDGGWDFRAVRGPLTARAVGAKPELAVTDPAVLLPLLPEFKVDTHEGVAFVPHWTTATQSVWQSACRQAHVSFIDPRDEAVAVIRRIASAKLVIAESMHGAIVADAFRVPWIPVVSARDTPLKWHDWALSMDMQYDPFAVGHLSIIPMMKGLTGVRRARPRMNDEDYRALVESVLQAFMQRSAGQVQAVRTSDGIKQRVKAQARSVLDRTMQRTLITRGAQILVDLQKVPATLSSDRVLKEKQDLLLNRMQKLQDDYRSAGIAVVAQ